MIVSDVMDEIAAQLDTIPGLRVFAWPVVNVNSPQVILTWPVDYEYDMTYGRGTDRMTLPVVLSISRATERTGRDALSSYMDGSGPKSIKAAVEAGNYTAFDSVRVTKVAVDVESMTGTDYYTAVFQLDIAGSGR